MSQPTSSVAYIYSIPELNQYTVEIKTSDESHFIEKGSEQVFYATIEDASTAAKSQGCEKGFLCLENTYDECGSIEPGERFSCLQVF